MSEFGANTEGQKRPVARTLETITDGGIALSRQEVEVGEIPRATKSRTAITATSG